MVLTWVMVLRNSKDCVLLKEMLYTVIGKDEFRNEFLPNYLIINLFLNLKMEWI